MFIKNSLLVGALFFLLILWLPNFSFGQEPCPNYPGGYTQLTKDRLVTTRAWIERVNSNYTKYNIISAQMLDDNSTLTILGIGSFEGAEVITEYGLLIFPESGISVGHLDNIYDPTSPQWINKDTLSVYYENKQYKRNTTSGQDYLVIDGLLNREIVQYNPCSTVIRSSFVQQNQDSVKLGEKNFVNIPLTQICGLIMAACVNYPAYPSMQDCLTFMKQLTPSKCPFAVTGNTTNCRWFHALNTLAIPSVHCQHTMPESTMCTEACLPDCGVCHANATCVADFINITIPHYKCACNEGFVGNGYKCTPKTCPLGQWQCPGPYSYSTCINQTCGCLDTLTWNPIDGTCGCTDSEQLFWYNGVPRCVPKGYCLEKYMCPQPSSYITCLPALNPVATSNPCICNYGFVGGFINQCTCLAPGRTVWSSTVDGNVCLQPTECTDGWHCASGVCNVDPGQQIGRCVSS